MPVRVSVCCAGVLWVGVGVPTGVGRGLGGHGVGRGLGRHGVGRGLGGHWPLPCPVGPPPHLVRPGQASPGSGHGERPRCCEQPWALGR